MMIHLKYTFIMIQSFVGQLFSDYNNCIASLLSSRWMESFSIGDGNNNSTCSPMWFYGHHGT
ncbi:hypothetical protein KSF78_0007858 [Schistosoma japonicum]|nr:hypothetical protein KSF78_0007856 [Schistosoma japonicum]KAH8873000.1 hypothetical protein KSF78_0007858 [Schistosoma japonicum]